MLSFEVIEASEPAVLPYDPEKFHFFVSTYAPYVSREPKRTVNVVRKLVTLFPDKEYSMRTQQECYTKKGYRVKCSACNWTGYRNGYQCECYEDWSMYCRPWTPGPGCPSGILWPCPRCNGHGFDYKGRE